MRAKAAAQSVLLVYLERLLLTQSGHPCRLSQVEDGSPFPSRPKQRLSENCDRKICIRRGQVARIPYVDAGKYLCGDAGRTVRYPDATAGGLQWRGNILAIPFLGRSEDSHLIPVTFSGSKTAPAAEEPDLVIANTRELGDCGVCYAIASEIVDAGWGAPRRDTRPAWSATQVYTGERGD